MIGSRHRKENYVNDIIQMKKSNMQARTEKGQSPERTRPKNLIGQQISDFLAFHRSCSPLITRVTQLLSFSIILHTLTGYLLLSNHHLSDYVKGTIVFLQQAVVLYRLLQLACYLMNIILIVSLVGAKLRYKNRIWYNSVRFIISLFSFLTKISLLMSGLLLYINFAENFTVMALSILNSIVEGLLMGNYELKKQENYRSSHRISFCLTIGTLVQFFVNSLMVFSKNVNFFCFSSAFFGIAMIIWHYIGGYGLFFHSYPRKVLLAACALMISLSFVMLMHQRRDYLSQKINYVEWVVLFVAVLFYLHYFEEKNRHKFINIEQLIKDESISLKEYQLNIQYVLQCSDDSKEEENLLKGLISLEVKTCSNPYCWSRQVEIFDPVLKRPFLTASLLHQKESVVRFYMKCNYTKALNINKTKQRMLDYAQFGVSDLGDLSHHCSILAELLVQKQKLSLLQRLHVEKLSLILRDQLTSFNKLIHEGKVEMEEVLQGETTYEHIISNIKQFCQRSSKIWRYALRREIQIQELKIKFQENFNVLLAINEQWSSIAKLLRLKRQWRCAYLSYSLFLSNQKLKNRGLSHAENLLQVEITGQSESDLLRQGCEKEKVILNDTWYFDRRSTILMCKLEDELRLLKVSQSFQRVTGYKTEQILGSPLSILMPVSLQQKHAGLVTNWLNGSNTNNQDIYLVKKGHFVSYEGIDVPVQVTFKMCVDLLQPELMLKFFCLMKTCQKNSDIRLGSFELTEKKQTKQSFFAELPHGQVEKDSNSLRLRTSCNIFLKQPHLQPNKDLSEAQNIKRVLRFFLIILLVLILTCLFMLNDDVSDIKQHAKAEVLFVNLYSLPMILAKYYYTVMMTDIAAPSLLQKVTDVTASLASYKDDPLTRQVLFNKQLCFPKNYQPFESNQVNQGISYSNVDTFYLLFSSISTLSKQQAIDPLSHDFIHFDSYLKPAYDEMLNSTKLKLYQDLKQYLSFEQKKIIVLMIILSIIFPLLACYLCWKLYHFFKKVQRTIQIILQFPNHEIQKMISYWQKVEQYFQKINRGKEKTLENEVSIGKTILNETEIHNQEIKHQKNTASLNQKHKKLVQSKQNKNKICKIFIILIILMTGMAGILLSIQIFKFTRIADLNYFLEKGYYLIRHSPTVGIADFAVNHRYYLDTHPQMKPFNIERFKDTLSTLLLITNYTYYSHFDDSSLYQEKLYNYLFGDPCVYNYDVLTFYQIPLTHCLGLPDNTIRSGILAYLRYAYPLIQGYLQGKLILSNATLKSLSRGLTICGYYLSDAINTWFEQFEGKLSSLNENCAHFALLACLLLLILEIMLFQMLIMRRMNSEYEFIRKVYSSGVSEQILLQEKIVRHQFYQSGILRTTN